MNPSRPANHIRMFRITARQPGATSEVKFRAEDGKEYDFFVTGLGIKIHATKPATISFEVPLDEVEFKSEL